MLPPGAGQEIGDAPLRLLRAQQAAGPFGLGGKAVALGVARQAQAHLAGGERQRMQAGHLLRQLLGLGLEVGARHRPLHHAELARGLPVDRRPPPE